MRGDVERAVEWAGPCACAHAVGGGRRTPQLATRMASLGFELAPTVVFSILRTVSIPSITLPKTTCLLSSQSQASHVIKNWQPFVPGPEFAICRRRRGTC